ncbi:hypothetical protein [Polyangium fumosum]|uniref:Uncharacterized protein n=1 Tax=Polyangium fumosum TaxID=889272 RepID=A0A4U1JD34_9BACT|nr:hypothetical protein [Polyangium fumosum]TKD08353.1 hypothetical protein E8A74_15630 [Polyangium fumosum]
MTQDSARERAAHICAAQAITKRRPPGQGAWDLARDPPADLAAIWANAGGLELGDGTRLLGPEEVGPATKWLTEEKSLGWDGDLFVIGERDDLVIVRDLDREGRRAGGGVLEAPTDGLEAFRRVAWDVLGYLETRLGFEPAPRPTPEIAAQKAASQKDGATLTRVLAEPFYPGSEAVAAHAALVLGEILAAAGDDVAAMRAFVRSVSFRVQGARRGAEALERAAGFRAAARVAESVGAKALAEACLTRVSV